MGILSQMISKAVAEGYDDADAAAKVCQDIILKGIADSPLRRNVTVKGGVVMRDLSGNTRRATQDMDLDFIRYSLSNDSIDRFISEINCVDRITIKRTGKIEELKQQDYHGKRVHILISDDSGDCIESKIDLGVHKNLKITQEEYCFDITSLIGSASLLINSKEQMFTEKLRSFLKFGTFSTRYKDIFDMCYLSETINKEELVNCFETFIFSDPGMRENTINDIIRRTEKTLSDAAYIQRLSSSDKNWLKAEPVQVSNKLLCFLKSVSDYMQNKQI